MSDQPMVHVVDDDSAFRESIKIVLEAKGYHIREYDHAIQFLATYTPKSPGCIILDLRMPGMSGLQLQEQLKSNGYHNPIIIMSSYSDIPSAVQAVQLGAIEVIEKPFEPTELVKIVEQAIELDLQLHQNATFLQEFDTCYKSLTPRERQVMHCVVDGLSNKQIASKFKLSIKTIEIHRGRMMHKIKAGNLAELVHMAMRYFGESEDEASQPICD